MVVTRGTRNLTLYQQHATNIATPNMHKYWAPARAGLRALGRRLCPSRKKKPMHESDAVSPHVIEIAWPTAASKRLVELTVSTSYKNSSGID
jgi:hypothetical protein